MEGEGLRRWRGEGLICEGMGRAGKGVPARGACLGVKSIWWSWGLGFFLSGGGWDG